MTTRLAKADILDELITPLVTDGDLAETDLYLNDLAAALDVDVDLIASPLPYKVKKLAIAYTCQEIAKRKASGSAGSSYKFQDSVDKFTTKLAIFQADVIRLEGQITADVLTGTTTPTAIGTIELERG